MADSHPLIAIDLLYERRDLVPVSRAAETLNAAGEDALDRVLALTDGEGTPAVFTLTRSAILLGSIRAALPETPVRGPGPHAAACHD